MRSGFQFLWPVLLSLLSLPAQGQTANGVFDRAFDKQRKGDFDGAIAGYTQVLMIEPKNAQAYNNRGFAKKQKGDLDGAMADLTQAIALDPKHANAYYNRGLVKKQKGDLEGAIADYTRALGVDPEFAQACNNRGLVKKQQGDLAGAIADYTRALEINPKHALACNNRGIAHYQNRSWTEALTDFRRKCDLSPRDADYPQLYIWAVRTQLGEKAAADKELDRYFALRSSAGGSGWAEKVGAFLLNRLSEGELLQAAASTDRNTERRQQCSAWFFSGMKLLLAGERTTAAEHFRKCLATERKNDPEYEFAAAELKALP